MNIDKDRWVAIVAEARGTSFLIASIFSGGFKLRMRMGQVQER